MFSAAAGIAGNAGLHSMGMRVSNQNQQVKVQVVSGFFFFDKILHVKRAQ